MSLAVDLSGCGQMKLGGNAGHLPHLRQRRSFQVSDDPGRYAADEREWFNILRDEGTCRNHGASSYVDAICQNSPGPDPDVIFDPDALGAESPLADWLCGIKDVIHGQDFGIRADLGVIAYINTTMAPDDRERGDVAVLSNLHAGVWGVVRVHDPDLRVLHDLAKLADLNPRVAGV